MSTTEKPPVAAAPKPALKTEYVVLELDGQEAWKLVFKGRSASAEQAIRQHLASPAAKADRALVAVPARSWQPVKPKTTTKTITTLEAL